jgi:CMP-N-acetylneuraminic acid synthetase/spore coat polysaccharide biosynthesis predicted glycosyltransferase SpsG
MSPDSSPAVGLGSTVLCVVPVRRGSKRVPRKALRPLWGQPLIVHALHACLAVDDLDVVVTTDDPVVTDLCTELGIRVIERPPDLAGDDVSLDPVVLDTWRRMGGSECYDTLVTVQATSPFVTPADIHAVLNRLYDSSADTAVTVVDDRHIRWGLATNDEPQLLTPRFNRQQLPPTYRETGAVVACTARLADSGRRFGRTVELVLLPEHRALDIDTPADFLVAEALRHQHSIAFNVVGSSTTGSGHAHRCLALAEALPGHEVHFVCDEDDVIVQELLRSEHYAVHVCPAFGGRLKTLLNLTPTIVVNDVLDTTVTFMTALREHLPTARVINFEDLGEGASLADAIVNALYPTTVEADGAHTGPEWDVLRREFTTHLRAPWREKVSRILVTFGGIDETGLTERFVGEVAEACKHRTIDLDIVLGLGYKREDELRSQLAELDDAGHISVSRSVNDLAARMRAADLAVTSAGRTVIECASQGLPSIVIAQNARETTHSFADVDHGIMNLGLGVDLPPGAMEAAFVTLVDIPRLRHELFSHLKKVRVPPPAHRLVPLLLGSTRSDSAHMGVTL